MKFIQISASFIVILFLTVSLLSSCEKKFIDQFSSDNALDNQATVQVYNAMVNSTRNYIYVDTKPVTGAVLVSGSVFPASGTGMGFAVPGGLRAFLVRDTIATATQVPLSFGETFQADKKYTVFLYDTITSPKQKTVQDNIVVPTDNSAMIRFANFVYSPTAVPAFDIYSKRQNATIFSNVALTDVTEFKSHPAGLTDTFYIRIAGTTTNLQNMGTATPPAVPAPFDISVVFTPTRGRSYTLVFRNGWRTTSTSFGTVRTLSVFANR